MNIGRHEDHFSAEAVASHLTYNAAAVLVSSEEIVERVRPFTKRVASDRLRAVTPSPGQSMAVTVGRLRIHVLRVRHNPVRRWPEQHVGFLVEDRRANVLHVGDADRTTQDFDVLRRLPRVDVALVPFWYVTGGLRASAMQSMIDRARVVAMHIPPADAASVSTQTSAAGSRVTLLTQPGSTIELRR